MKREVRICLLVASTLVTFSQACGLATQIPTATGQSAVGGTATESGSAPVAVSTPPAGVYPELFAEYIPVSVTLPAEFKGGYTLPLDLSHVEGQEAVALSAAQKQKLAQYGFVVQPPGDFREFYNAYESFRYLDVPVFITSDAVLHIYHLIFDKMLRDLEREYFIADIDSFTRVMLRASYSQYQAVRGTALEDPALRNVAYFAVAARLMESAEPIPPETAALADAELSLILAHGGWELSPIWDRPDLGDDKKLREDYSQYLPRGHYTRSEELQRYFRTMMWYGRMTFRLRDDFETRRALLVTQALRTASADDGTPAMQLWKNVYDPTVFIVGKSDDLSFTEYGALSDSAFGSGADPNAFVDDAKLRAFLETAKSLPPPQINSMWVWITEDKDEATKGFRVMGQRFTLDQYVFGQLIWRNVGTMDAPRGLPKGLDFFAALGSEEAYSILQSMGEAEYANYDTQMAKVQGQIAGLEMDSWTQTLYWNWLYTLRPLVTVKDHRYPAFMRNQAWVRKDLNTALASWTELKHDTILYAKQVMAELGGGPPGQPPHGYVEPNPELYARLLALTRMTKSGLENRSMLSETTRGNLENLIHELEFLQTTSEKELAGVSLSGEDYWSIQYFGGILESFTLAAADADEETGKRILEDQKCALVADVASGLNRDGSLAALEEGVGQPSLIIVVLPDSPWRIGVGAVFSYYEFVVSPDQRMTDEAWQAWVESDPPPVLPDWTSLYLVP